MVGLLQVNPRNKGARSLGLAEVGYNLSGEDSEIMTTARSYKSKGSEPLKTDCHGLGLEHNLGTHGQRRRTSSDGKG